MVRIPTYQAKEGYDAVAQPNVRFDTSVGEATSGLGQAIGRGAGTVAVAADRAAERRRQKEAFAAEQAYTLLGEQAEQSIIENQRSAPPDGDGITAGTLSKYDDASNEFYRTLSPELQEEFAPRLTLQRTRIGHKASNTEWETSNRYSSDTVNQFAANGAARIAQNPGDFEAIEQEGHALIDKAPNLTSAQRLDAHQKWTNLSKVGLGRGIQMNDPEVAQYAFGSTDVQGRYGVIADRIMKGGLIEQESAWNPKAVSGKNAIGLAQIWYPTSIEIAKEMGDTHFLAMSKEAREAYLKNPEVSMRFGKFYLTKMLTMFNGDIPKALAAYNAGPGSAKSGKGVLGAMAKAQAAGSPDAWLDYMPAETRNYVPSIMAQLGNEKYLGGTRLQKPVVVNADGSVSTEKSITFESDGEWVNIPTIVDGVEMSESDAIELYKAGVNPALGSYGSLAEAEEAARERSEAFGTDGQVAIGEEPFFSPAFEGVSPVTMQAWQREAQARVKKTADAQTAEGKLAETQLKEMLENDPKTLTTDGVGLVRDVDVPRFEMLVQRGLGKDGLSELFRWRKAREQAHRKWIATGDMAEITTDEIMARRRDLTAAKTADQIEVRDYFNAAADKEIELRRLDPGEAVLRVPEIKAMHDAMDTRNPDSVQRYLRAVEATQVRLGMLPPAVPGQRRVVAPRLLPRSTAIYMAQQLRGAMAEPGADPAAVTLAHLNKFRDSDNYGQYADEIFTQVYAETLDRSISQDTRLVVASTMGEWMQSQPTPSRPGHAAAHAARIAAELAASEKAMGEESKAESRSWWEAIKGVPADTYRLIFGEDGEPVDIERGQVAPDETQAPQGGGASAIPGVDRKSLDWFLQKYPDPNISSDFEKRFGSKAFDAAVKLANDAKKAKNR